MVARVPGTERFIPKFEYDLIDLPALSVRELGDVPLLRVILELLKRATDGTLDDVRSQILEPLVAIRDDDETRYWIQRILRYMDDVLTQQKKHLTREKVDQMIQPIYHERSEDMAKTFFGQIEAQGKAEGTKEVILSLLDARFHRMPEHIEAEIRAMRDLTALKSLAVHAATCQSLEEFEKYLH